MRSFPESCQSAAKPWGVAALSSMCPSLLSQCSTAAPKLRVHGLSGVETVDDPVVAMDGPVTQEFGRVTSDPYDPPAFFCGPDEAVLGLCVWKRPPCDQFGSRECASARRGTIRLPEIPVDLHRHAQTVCMARSKQPCGNDGCQRLADRSDSGGRMLHATSPERALLVDHHHGWTPLRLGSVASPHLSTSRAFLFEGAVQGEVRIALRVIQRLRPRAFSTVPSTRFPNGPENCHFRVNKYMGWISGSCLWKISFMCIIQQIRCAEV